MRTKMKAIIARLQGACSLALIAAGTSSEDEALKRITEVHQELVDAMNPPDAALPLTAFEKVTALTATRLGEYNPHLFVAEGDDGHSYLAYSLHDICMRRFAGNGLFVFAPITAHELQNLQTGQHWILRQVFERAGDGLLFHYLKEDEDAVRRGEWWLPEFEAIAFKARRYFYTDDDPDFDMREWDNTGAAQPTRVKDEQQLRSLFLAFSSEWLPAEGAHLEAVTKSQWILRD